MSRPLLFLVLLWMAIATWANGQAHEQCGHGAYKKYLENKYSSYKNTVEELEKNIARKKLLREGITGAATNVYKIPVVFHIVYNTESRNISEARIADQLMVLNQDYQKLNRDTVNIPSEFKSIAANVGFQFCLATRNPKGEVTNGINRIRTSQISYDYNFDDEKLKAISYWPSDQYLNIWVTQLSDDILGYAQFPGNTSLPDLSSKEIEELDGVVVDVDAFGLKQNNSRYNLGRTLTHEVGHWLGLLHNFEGAPCGNDFIDDTPPQDSSSQNLKPSFCEHFSYCSGLKSLDMSGNFMDYSPDVCMNMFTLGQRERMHAVMQSAPLRIKILNSFACYNPIYTAPLPYSENFNSGIIPVPDTANTNTTLRWELIKINPENAYLKCANTLFNKGQRLNYNFPFIDFTKSATPVLSFQIASAANALSKTDSIVISHNPNPQLRYVLAKLTGSQLTNGKTKPLNSPDSAWHKIKIDLKTLAGKYNTGLKIEFYSKGISNVYLDDVRVYENQTNSEIKLYPVPTTGELTASIIQGEQEEMSFEIVNCLGKSIRTWQVKKETEKENISTIDLAAGLYFLRTTFLQSQEVKISKFSIE